MTDRSLDVFWARDARAQLPNASTTKMVTALVTVAQADLDDEVTVSPAAAATPGGLLELAPGEILKVSELLEGLLLASSNDAAVALAEHVSGSEDAFVAEMNEFASEMGVRDTRFVTAHGLDTPGHYSTPLDLARIGRELLANPALARIVALDSATVQGSDGAEVVDNSNELIGSFPGAIGIKTGMTALAGDVLVAAARRAGMTIFAVTMRSQDASEDAVTLLDYGFRRAAEISLFATRTLIEGAAGFARGPARASASLLGPS